VENENTSLLYKRRPGTASKQTGKLPPSLP
jgi:hypothetical protein